MRTATDHRPIILQTAARLFGQRPFHQVLMEDVAARAGIAKGTIYRFYATKEALYADICLRSLDQLGGALRKAAHRKASASERLTNMIRCVADHFQKRRDFFHVVQREWGGNCQPNRAAFLARRSRHVALFARVIREGQAAQEFRAIDASASADMLLGMIRSMIRFGDPRLSATQLSRLVLDLFTHGITKPKGKNDS